MPLVFVVLVIIVVVMVSNDSMHRTSQSDQVEMVNMRKTNHDLEVELYKKYREKGLDDKEATQESRRELISLGFDPSNAGDWMYGNESESVHYARKVVRLTWEWEHPGEEMTEERVKQEAYDRFFPMTSGKHYRLICAKCLLNPCTCIRTGGYVRHQWQGLCEVVGHKFSKDYSSGSFILKTRNGLTFKENIESKYIIERIEAPR